MTTSILSGPGPNPPGAKVYRAFREFAAVTAEHFEDKLPDDYAQRIAAGNTAPMYRTQGMPLNVLGWDIAAGIVHGYATRPELLDTWTGSGFTSLVDHAATIGGLPVAVPLFGLDPDVAANIGMRSTEDMAGAARLAVKDTKPEDIPACFSGGAKYAGASAPALTASTTVRKALLLSAFPDYVPLIELMGDVDIEVLHQSLARIQSAMWRRAHGGLGEVAALMVRAEREKLSLSECLRVWSLIPGQTDLTLDAVRNGVPDDYLLEATAPR